MIGKRQEILRSNVHPSNFYKELWTKISKGEIWQGEICNQKKDGSLFWSDATIIPFLNKKGEVFEYITVRRDITQQKEMSEKILKSERLTAIGELAARIAHDIRNPLAVINNDIQILKHYTTNIEKDVAPTYERVERAIIRISYQIKNVLDYVKIRPIEKSISNISNIVNGGKSAIPIPKGIEIEFLGEDFEIECDTMQFEIVFSNLFMNSIQAMNEKGKITIQAQKTENFIEISIKDSGPGISDDLKTRVFEPLFTTKQRGTGLGLASCKNIVKQHGGTIRFDDNDNSKIIISIPA